MAKSPAVVAPEASPETTSPQAPAKRVFSFAVEFVDVVPDVARSSSLKGQTSIPWQGLWSSAEKAVLETDKAARVFVPFAYYIEERGISPAKVDHGYVRQKISDEFAKWRKADPERGEKFDLVRADVYEPEPGVNTWLAKRKASA